MAWQTFGSKPREPSKSSALESDVRVCYALNCAVLDLNQSRPSSESLLPSAAASGKTSCQYGRCALCECCERPQAHGEEHVSCKSSPLSLPKFQSPVNWLFWCGEETEVLSPLQHPRSICSVLRSIVHKEMAYGSCTVALAVTTGQPFYSKGINQVSGHM